MCRDAQRPPGPGHAQRPGVPEAPRTARPLLLFLSVLAPSPRITRWVAAPPRPASTAASGFSSLGSAPSHLCRFRSLQALPGGSPLSAIVGTGVSLGQRNRAFRVSPALDSATHLPIAGINLCTLFELSRFPLGCGRSRLSLPGNLFVTGNWTGARLARVIQFLALTGAPLESRLWGRCGRVAGSQVYAVPARAPRSPASGQLPGLRLLNRVLRILTSCLPLPQVWKEPGVQRGRSFFPWPTRLGSPAQPRPGWPPGEPLARVQNHAPSLVRQARAPGASAWEWIEGVKDPWPCALGAPGLMAQVE